MKKNSFYSVVKAALVVGTLDIMLAFIQYFITTGDKNIGTVLKYIASAVFGKEAWTGGILMNIAGLLFHYMIAFWFTLLFFWLYSRISLFSRNKILTGVLYGIFIWILMNLVVVPLSRIPEQPITISNALVSSGIVIFCIGIPLSFMANAFYTKADMLIKNN